MTTFRAYSGSTYTIPLPEGHRFPMYKYAGVRYILEQSGLEILEPSRPSWEQVERVHTHLGMTDAIVRGVQIPMAGCGSAPHDRRAGGTT